MLTFHKPVLRDANLLYNIYRIKSRCYPYSDTNFFISFIS
ncbi:hypothetical protein CHK_2835 [Christensenella hongkongensis]|uniref:Uncharacterized protein n=1 Tax=Christensenella hongkongensis TaxID=270498 RepID=A0A0M2NBK5_9FIRM|nr:hypothetical protein CHK_2835 [Christensenella hongkongensis]